MEIKDGWYLVTVKNNSRPQWSLRAHQREPKNDKVDFFNEWVELIDGYWDLSKIGDVNVMKVIEDEKNDTNINN